MRNTVCYLSSRMGLLKPSAYKMIYLTGAIVRIAPKQYSINDPAVIKTIYGIGKGFLKVRIVKTMEQFCLTDIVRFLVRMVRGLKSSRPSLARPLHRSRWCTSCCKSASRGKPLLCHLP